MRALFSSGKPDPHAKLWKALELNERRALCQKAGIDPQFAYRQWDSFDARQCAAIAAAWRRWRDRVAYLVGLIGG